MGQNAKDYWNTGFRRTFTEIFIGSQFVYPKDEETINDNFREVVSFRLYQINFDGIPLLVLERKVVTDEGALRGSAKELNVSVNDVRLWGFQGVEN